jgi:hypothetical protein
MTLFVLALAAVIVVLSALVIKRDAHERQQRLESKIREVKSEADREWEEWAKIVAELITASCPPEEREWRLKQFYRDHPRPGNSGQSPYLNAHI